MSLSGLRRWLIMSHFILIHAVYKFSYSRTSLARFELKLQDLGKNPIAADLG